MPISEKVALRKPRESEEDKDENATLALCELACILAPHKSAISGIVAPDHLDTLGQLTKLIKRSMHQKKDEVLYDAMARIEAMGREPGLLLKQAIEQAAEITVIERAEGKKMEINAFVIPLFLHTTGGLEGARCFQDQEAFESLSKSLQSGELESPEATVVLVNHGYHINEIDSITYSHLHEMLRDAFHAMTDKRAAATAAIDRSISGWPDSPFSAGERAIELRFLLGFSLKTIDDPFYVVPDEGSAADTYFATRDRRFQQWTISALPMIRRCFGIMTSENEPGDAHGDVHFLYQDFFHGGKEHGIAEYFTLQLMSELNRGIQTNGVAPKNLRAIVGPYDHAGEAILRVQLFDANEHCITQAEKPVPTFPDWENEFAQSFDALATIGVHSVRIAKKFAADGKALDTRPYLGPQGSDSAESHSEGQVT